MSATTIDRQTAFSADADFHKMLPSDEAAEFLGLKAQTLAVWRMTGKGPAFTKLGRAVRYRLSVLKAYVRSHTIGGDSAE